MTFTNLLVFFLSIQLLHGFGTWRLYAKAGFKSWQAFVPIYNAFILMRIINRPWYWVPLLFLPVINLIMLPVTWVETCRSFGRNSKLDTFLVVVTLGLYLFVINYSTDIRYVENRSLHAKSTSGDWVSSILFAVVAATFVHTYFFQPFVIPTSSLEKTLLVGDFLIVSKVHYGARIPMTTIAAPMVHDTLPLLNVKSYLPKLELPYMRIPGFEKIERNDIVVFNWPVDTMMNMYYTDKYYYKPIDKKTNYVKRCVAVAGDTLEVIDGYVHINGKRNVLPDRAQLQFSYLVQPKSYQFDAKNMRELYGITDPFGIINRQNTYKFMAISDGIIGDFKNNPNVEKLVRDIDEPGKAASGIFPNDNRYPWNYDYFGPLYVPKAGQTIALSLDNLPLYERVIRVYENNDLKIEGNTILINGKVANKYTFNKDYYWMMGDNRHNSQDARVWGFVPFDHVVGKPVFVWMSWDTNGSGFGKIRWERLFTTVGGSGKPVSYLIPFLAVILGWWGYRRWKHRKSI